MRYAIFTLILIAVLAISIPASLASTDIPDWIRQTALLYGEGTISDDTFLGAIQFLVNEGLLKVDAPTEPEPNPDHVIPAAWKHYVALRNRIIRWHVGLHALFSNLNLSLKRN